MGKETCAIRKMSFVLYQDCLQARAQVRLPHRYRTHQSSKQDSSQVERNETLGETRQNTSTTTDRGQEKCTMTVNGSLIRTPSTGSTWPGHQKRDCSFGRQGLTPLLFTIQCRPTASKKRYSLKGDITLYQSPSTRRPAPNIILKDVCKLRQQQQHHEEHKEISSGAEPRHPKEHRETCCGGGESIQSWSQNPRNPAKCSDRRSRKNVQKFKIWLTSCDLNAKPSRSLPMWKRKENSTFQRSIKTYNSRIGPCGACLVPSPEQKRTNFKDDSRGAKHGLSQWQYDHWKAGDATKGARKKGKDFIVQRWQEDETYRASQTVHGWTEEYCRYLDDLAPIHMSYVATWKERSRCEKQSCAGTQ